MGLAIGNFVTKDFLANKGFPIGDEEDTNIYGVRFESYMDGLDEGSNRLDTTGVRTYGAENFNFVRSTITNAGKDDFTDKGAGPFRIRECVTLHDAITHEHTVIGYKGDANWDSIKNNSSYNRMIEFPKFYYNRPTPYEFMVSSNYQEGFLPSPMHYRNGVLHDKVYVTKYRVGPDFMSKANVQSKISTDLATFRTGLRNIGMYVVDYPVCMSIAMLMFINIQNIIGLGHSSSTAAVNTGATESVKSQDGTVVTSLTADGSVVTLGLENWYGNLWTAVDGIFKDDANNIYINEDIEHVVSNPTNAFVGYTKVSTPCSTNATNPSYVKRLALDPEFPYMMYPTECGNTIENSMNDGYWFSSINNPTMMFLGGAWTRDSVCGPLCCYINSPLNYANVGFSASGFFFK